jgi:hypothetical protein
VSYITYPASELATSRVLAAVEKLTQFNHQLCLQIQQIQLRKKGGYCLLSLL